MASSLGVDNFPTILLKVGDNYSMIAKSYAKCEEMIVAIDVS